MVQGFAASFATGSTGGPTLPTQDPLTQQQLGILAILWTRQQELDSRAGGRATVCYTDSEGNPVDFIEEMMMGLLWRGLVAKVPATQDYILTDPGLEYCRSQSERLTQLHEELSQRGRQAIERHRST